MFYDSDSAELYNPGDGSASPDVAPEELSSSLLDCYNFGDDELDLFGTISIGDIHPPARNVRPINLEGLSQPNYGQQPAGYHVSTTNPFGMAVPTYQPTATLAPVVLEANPEYGPRISFLPASSRRALFEEDDDDDDDDDEESNSDRDSIDQELLDLATPANEDEVRSDAGSVCSFGGNEGFDNRSASPFGLAGPGDGQELILPSLPPASEMRAFSDLTTHEHDEILGDDGNFAEWFDSLPEEDDVDPAATAQPVQVSSE